MYLNKKKYTSKVYTDLFIPLISTECLPWYTHLGHTHRVCLLLTSIIILVLLNFHMIPLKHLMFILFALHNFQTCI
jgi:hypothetical protein